MWMAYAVCAFAAVGVSNIIDKVLVDKFIQSSAMITLFTGFVGLATGILIFILRGFPFFPLDQVLVALGAGILLEFYLLPYFKALELDDPSRVIPYFQLIPVITMVLSLIFLGETLVSKQYAGAALIVTSAFFLSLEKTKKRFGISKAFWYMVLASLLFACSSILFKFVAEIQNTWDSLAYESIGIGIGALILASRRSYAKEFLHYTKRLSPVGWMSLASSESFYVLHRMLFGFALALGPAGLVSLFYGFQPVFVFLYGFFLTLVLPNVLREDIRKVVIQKKIIAIGIIFFGLYLIYV